jgi:hypothetical protein
MSDEQYAISIPPFVNSTPISSPLCQIDSSSLSSAHTTRTTVIRKLPSTDILIYPRFFTKELPTKSSTSIRRYSDFRYTIPSLSTLCRIILFQTWPPSSDNTKISLVTSIIPVLFPSVTGTTTILLRLSLLIAAAAQNKAPKDKGTFLGKDGTCHNFVIPPEKYATMTPAERITKLARIRAANGLPRKDVWQRAPPW